MCGRYNNHRQAMERWREILLDWPSDEAWLRYNVPPTSDIPIVTAEGVRIARWGMIPSWAKEFKSKYATFNACIETVGDLPTFRNAWKASRTCLVPAAGYYEWPEYLDKQPYYIHKPNDMLVFAGLWEPWGDKIKLHLFDGRAARRPGKAPRPHAGNALARLRPSLAGGGHADEPKRDRCVL